MLFVASARSLKRQQASQVAGFTAMAIAAMAFIGWWAKLPMLSSWGAAFTSTKPLTALCIIALGLVLVHPGKSVRVALAIGLSVAAVATLDLTVELLGVELGIDHRLVPRATVPGSGATSFQMINGMPLAIALAGSSLALSRLEGHHFAATALGGLASVMATFALLAHLTGIHVSYGWFKPPPLATAVGVLCVAGAILLQIGTTPPLREPRPLWHLLIMLGCAIVAPVLLFGVYVGARVTDEHLRHVRNDLMSEARTISVEIDHEIIGEIERLQALAASSALREGDFAEFQRQAEASLAFRQSDNIILVDRNMQQLVDTRVPLGTPLPKTVIPEPIEKALATGKPQVTDLFMSTLVQRLLFGIMVPVQIDGENRYVLARSPDPHALEYPVATHELPPGWLAVVSDTARRIIARSEQGDAFIGQELPLAQWHRAERGGVFEFIDSQGRPSLQGYAWSELTGWETAVWAPSVALEAPVRALWLTIGVMASLAFALVVALASWLGRIITRSVGHAARAAIALGEGGPLPLLGTSVAEVDTLIAELRRTAVKQQAAEHLLRESEHQLRLVTDNVPVAIARCDTEARYKFINRYRAERLGLGPEQVIGKRMSEVIGDKVFAIVEPHVRECLAGKAVEFEVAVPCQAGERQFMHCRFEPEWRDGKVVGLVAATTNITSLKRAEAACRESEAMFRAMFDVSSVGKIEVDPGSACFLRANAAMCEFVGYSEAELLTRTVLDITHPDERDRDREMCRRLATGKLAAFDVEKRYIRKDGNAVWARTTVNVIRDESGRPLRHIAVVQDLNARKQAEQDLQTSKGRLQLAMDAAQLGWWQYDPRHRTLSGDSRSKEIFDITADETPADEIKKRVHPDDAESFEVAREATLASVDPKSHAMEFRLRRGDGEVRWVEVHWLTYFEGDGPQRRPVSIVGTVADITERKEREEKEHLLMREINHRAKNMLSVVHAIARQTAIRNPEDFIDRFSERIQALSANHDLLVRNEWNGVEIEDLVRAQLAPFVDLISSRISVQGPKLRLNAASAQAVGLVLHELATNAGKYGALSADRGRVNICWGIDSNTYTMSWVESDGPSVSAPARRGFGTMVMQAMAEHSVDGTVSLDYAPSGVTWRLICPAANALEPGERGYSNRTDGATGEVKAGTTA